jgi:hypothetical protein
MIHLMPCHLVVCVCMSEILSLVNFYAGQVMNTQCCELLCQCFDYDRIVRLNLAVLQEFSDELIKSKYDS